MVATADLCPTIATARAGGVLLAGVVYQTLSGVLRLGLCMRQCGDAVVVDLSPWPVRHVIFPCRGVACYCTVL